MAAVRHLELMCRNAGPPTVTGNLCSNFVSIEFVVSFCK